MLFWLMQTGGIPSTGSGVSQYGLNFVNEHTVSSDGELYDDLCRNIFSYTDSAREICVTGTVEWCSRDGSFTEFLVKDDYA